MGERKRTAVSCGLMVAILLVAGCATTQQVEFLNDKIDRRVRALSDRIESHEAINRTKYELLAKKIDELNRDTARQDRPDVVIEFLIKKISWAKSLEEARPWIDLLFEKIGR